MIDYTLFLLALTILAALVFDFSNGWNDSANAIATVVSTRVLSPIQAIVLSATLNFVGAFVSTKVAKSIAGKIVDPSILDAKVILASMIGAAIWTIALTKFGLPISCSHALIGGIMGSAVIGHGMGVLNIKGLTPIFLALLISPVLGMLFGLILMRVLNKMFANWAPRKVNSIFGKLQLISVSFMALSHGTNDAQKVMGVITMALVSAGVQTTLDVPVWVILLCALTIALGTALGGWKVIQTLGMNLIKLQPVHGFAAETSASGLLFFAAFLGLPVSTTHVITGSVLGVGSARRFSAVRWGIGKKIIYAWVFTLPASAVFAALIYLFLNAVLP
ncbi:MAG: inorganic phosphate transporter [Candidatus Schekmanbacteria bacterium]|nr:inorganic phosphate transporter [Candidatus Schekmanbacteria bacterium]